MSATLDGSSEKMAGTTLLGYPAPLETLPPSGVTPERTAAGKRLPARLEGPRERATSAGRAALGRQRGPAVPSGKSRLPARAGLWGRRNTDGVLEPHSWETEEETSLLRPRPSRRALLAVGVCLGLGLVGAITGLATRRQAPTTGVEPPTGATFAPQAGSEIAPAPSEKPVRTIVAAPEPRPARPAPAASVAPEAKAAIESPPTPASPAASTPKVPPPAPRVRRATSTRARRPDLDADAVLEPSF